MTTLNQDHSNRKYLFILLGLIASVILVMAFSSFVDWNTKHYFAKQSPISLKVQSPIVVRERDTEVKVVEKMITPVAPEQVDTPIKKLICDTWGQYECLTAVAVSMGEGLRQAEDESSKNDFNINDNGTIDVGPMRVNSVHFDKPGCSFQEVVFDDKNVACAYRIWDESDPEHKLGDGKGSWEPWVAYWSGAYLAHLDN